VDNLVDKICLLRADFLVAKRCRKRDFGARKFCGTSRRGPPDRRSRWGRCGLSSTCVGLRAAHATSLRAGPGKGAESSQPTVPSRAAGEGEDRKGAGGFPQVGDKLWRTSCPGRGNSWMEGTSGAADRGPLRGGSGEAALGPGWCARKRPPIRAGGKAAQAAFPGPAAPRERVVLGAVAGIAKAGSRGELVAGPVTRASSTCAGSRRRWLFRPAAPRAHDTRCPSRSGWGEALAARNRSERCRVAKAVRPLARETSAGAEPKQGRAARPVSSRDSAPPGRVTQAGAQAHVWDQWGAQAHP
jgi:hypothetical protein